MREHADTGAPRRVSRMRRSQAARTTIRLVGWAVLGAALASMWLWRQRLGEVFGPWWVVSLAFMAVTFLVRLRPTPPKSAAHPALQVRRGQHWPYRPTLRPLGRRSDVPNVFVDADSFALAAWPGADIDAARRWTVDASARVAARFGTTVAVLVGQGAPVLPDREGVRVVNVPDGGSIRDALWQVVAPVEPSLLMLFVTDRDEAALAALAHGAEVMPCRNWMTLADR